MPRPGGCGTSPALFRLTFSLAAWATRSPLALWPPISSDDPSSTRNTSPIATSAIRKKGLRRSPIERHHTDRLRRAAQHDLPALVVDGHLHLVTGLHLVGDREVPARYPRGDRDR